MKKFSIITPCFNAEKYIEETVQSVIGQSAIQTGSVELEYIICDGGSSDRTVSIIESIRDRTGCKSIKILSEQDSGMYDALSKGLKLASGDIVAYINAGDFYNKWAFDVVLEVFDAKSVDWLTGYNVFYNERSQVTHVELPFRYRKSLFACGYYGTKLPYVQQESTFWSSTLNEHIDYSYLPTLKYAGDFYIWLQFSKVRELKIVESYLGGFKFHRGQLSGSKEKYLSEIFAITSKPTLKEVLAATFDQLIWRAPTRIKKSFNKDGLFRFDHELQQWV